MGYIKKLKNNELVGGTDKHTIYPVTSTKAVFEEITNGNESSFKSQKTINKEQQDELDDHEERIQVAEAEDIKSITINGSTKKFEVDDENNVDLTIYTVDNDPEMPSIASNVEDLRNMVGTSTPVLETSHKTRIETLEGGESVTGSVENKIKTKVDSINSSYQDDNNEYVKYSMTQTSGEVTNFNIDETSLKNAITSLNTSISGDNIVIRSGSTPSGTGEVGKIYRYVNSSNNTYTDYMYSGGSWIALATHDTSNEQAQVAYYTCTATGSGAQATKQFVGNGSLEYTPSSGGHIKILMGEANTATGTIYLQYNTDSTNTKKPLYYNGEPVSPGNTWEAGETIAVYYNPSANNNTGAYFASNAQGGGGKAEKIKYDNFTSGLAAANVQEAIDETAFWSDDVDVNLDSVSAINYGLWGTGWHSTNNGIVTKKLDVREGQIYTIEAGTLATSIFFMDVYNPRDNVAVSFITRSVAANTTDNVAVPQGMLYMVFQDDHARSTGTPWSIFPDGVTLHNITKVKDKVLENTDDIESLQEVVDEQLIIKTSILEDIVPGNGCIKYTDNSVWSKQNTYICGWIDVSEYTGKEIIVINNNHATYIAFTKEKATANNEVIQYATGWNGSHFISGSEEKFVVPSDAKYLCVYMGTNNDSAPSSVLLCDTLKNEVLGIENSIDDIVNTKIEYYEEAYTNVQSTNKSKLIIQTQQNGSIVVTNTKRTAQVYAYWFLPETLNIGDEVLVKFDFTSTSTYGGNDINISREDGTVVATFITPLPDNTSGTIERTFVKQDGYDCFKLYSSNMSDGAVLTFSNISISVVGTVNDRIDHVEERIDSIEETVNDLSQFDFISNILPISYTIRDFNGNVIHQKTPNKFNYEYYMPLMGTGQGAAVYGDYLFQMKGSNSSGIYIYNMLTKKHLYDISLTPNSSWHGDSLSFSKQFYSDNDYFPLLYVSQSHGESYLIQVYRIQTSDFKTFTATLVQNITMPDKEVGCWYADAVLDNNNNFLYYGGDTYPTDSSFTWKKFSIPNWNSGTLVDGVYELAMTSEDVLDSFSIEGIGTNVQGQTFYNGYLFFSRGYSGVGYNQFFALNLTTKQIETSINLMPTTINEVEQSIVWNNTIYFVGQGDAVYKIMFGW